MVHTWHILQYLAYTAIPGIYRNTWHIPQYLAYIAIPGIYRNTWHISQYLDSLLYRTQRGRNPADFIYSRNLQISSAAEFYKFLRRDFTDFICGEILQISSAAEIYRFHLQQKFTDFICNRILQISSAAGFQIPGRKNFCRVQNTRKTMDNGASGCPNRNGLRNIKRPADTELRHFRVRFTRPGRIS